jgi:hypothetical protein
MTIWEPSESLKLGPDADFGVLADGPIDATDEGIEAVWGKGKTPHLCLSSGSHRKTLQDGLYVLRPLIAALHVAGRSFRDIAKNLNVAASCDV